MVSLKIVNWFAFERGSVAERLERWTQCNPEAPSSSPALTTNWICSR